MSEARVDGTLEEWGLSDADLGLDDPETPAATPAPAENPPPAEPVGETHAAPAAGSAPSPDVVPPPSGSPPAAASPEAPLSSPPPAAVPPASAPDTPYQGRDGVTIAGATVTSDGHLRIQKEAVPYLERTLLSERALQRQVGEVRRQITDTSAQLNQEREVSRGLVQRFQQMLELAERDPNALLQWAHDMKADLPRFALEQEKRRLEGERDRLAEQARQAERERMRPVLEPQYRQGVQEQLAHMIQTEPTLAGLDAGAAIEEVWRWKDHGLLTDAPMDDPNGAFRAGETVVNLPFLYQLASQAHQNQQRLAQARQQWEADARVREAQAQATQRNQAATAPTPAPPTVTATSKTVAHAKRDAQPRNTDGTFAKKASDWEDEFLSAPID